MNHDRDASDPWSEIEYLAGRASDAQVHRLDARFSADGFPAAEFNTLKGAWEHTSATEQAFDHGSERDAWQALRQRIQQESGSAAVLTESLRNTVSVTERRSGGAWLGRRTIVAGIAAMAAVAAVVIGIAETRGPVPAADSALRSSYATANGERARIELPDGTTVVLNAASRLEIPRSYGSGDRTVRLSGEAYFDVKHATGTPFVVESGAVRTTVLGTEFGVRAYQASDVQVAVRTGKVLVNNAVLTANDVARVTDAGATVAKNQNLDVSLAFASGRLLLPETTVAAAIGDLNRWYDADIRFGDAAVGQLRLQGALANGSIEDLRNILELTLGVRIERAGRTLTLYTR